MALTKVTGQVVNTSTDLTVGVLTATTASFTGNVSVGGTLTYEDVTNVDSVGLITARNGIEVTDKGVQVGTGATIDSAAANTLTFLTNGSERVRVDSSGNFGINDTGPNFPLDVNGNIGIREGQVLTWHDGAGNKAGDIYMDSSDNFVIRNTSSVTERMRINSSGNMGLGTASPSAPFHIDNPGDTSITQILETGNAQVSLVLRNSTSTGNNIQLNATGNDFRILTNATERMRIDSSGNMGLGTASPNNQLHLVGSSPSNYLRIDGSNGDRAFLGVESSAAVIYAQNNSGGNAPITFNTGSSERVRIGSDGNFSIGTTTNTNKLRVHQGSDSANIILATGADESSEFISLGIDSGVPTLTAGGVSSTSASLAFRTSDSGTESERMRIDSSGRLLIGTTADKSISSDTNALVQIFTSTAGKLLIGRSDASVVDNDFLGIIDFHTFDGGSQRGARIAARADGDHASGDVPSRIEFSTCADGSSTLTERIRIDSAGRIGINNTSPSSTVNIGGDAITAVKPTVCIAPSSGSGSLTIRGGEPTLCFDQTGGNDQRIIYDNSSDLIFQNGTLDSITERVRFFDTGQTHHFSSTNCFVSATSQGAGTTTWLFRGIRSRTTNTSGGSTVFYVYSNGNVQNTNNSYGSISDAKLKENIVNATSQWEDLKALQIRKYNFIEGETHTQLGVVAQEVETVSPGLVTDIVDRDEEGNDLGTVTKTVNYSVLYMKAVKALQEAMDRIETLEAQVAALQG